LADPSQRWLSTHSEPCSIRFLAFRMSTGGCQGLTRACFQENPREYK
jgi:hypothetical protein